MNSFFAKSSNRPYWALAALIAIAAGVVAWARVGMLNLPSVPPGLTLFDTGLARLDEMKRLDDFIRSADSPAAESWPPAARTVRDGYRLALSTDGPAGLAQIREGLLMDPANLVLANAYRMAAFQLRRESLKDAWHNTVLAPEFPDYLKNEPIAFFEQLAREHPSPQTKLSLALAWVDHMLLFPALEIKAPSSVESVDILTELIEGDHAGYVPALFARGLNHLHRPSRLVWPESSRTPIDAAAVDIGRCVAIGRKFDVGSDRLRAILATALGDAYVKAGRLNVARSWWQIAQNLCRDEDVQEAINRRYAWRDETILDELEAELDRSRSALDHPMTDLAMMWN